MQIEYIETSTVDQQQAMFGYQDHFVRMIEKAFSVLIGLRESKVEIKERMKNASRMLFLS